MNTCEGCIYFQDMVKIKSGQGFVWGSTTSHPCIACKRFPQTRDQFPDNYQDGEEK